MLFFFQINLYIVIFVWIQILTPLNVFHIVIASQGIFCYVAETKFWKLRKSYVHGRSLCSVIVTLWLNVNTYVDSMYYNHLLFHWWYLLELVACLCSILFLTLTFVIWLYWCRHLPQPWPVAAIIFSHVTCCTLL